VACKLSPAIRFTVNMDKYGREIISTEAGHMELSRFISGEVRAVDSHITPRLKKSWTIEIGPGATHTISVERKNLVSKIVIVSIDGHKLLESPASDVNAAAEENAWNCEFRFVGDKFLEFDMENAYAYAQQAQKNMEKVILRNYEKSAFPDFVTTPIRVMHRCLISMTGLSSISDAKLVVDGTRFNELRLARAPEMSHEPLCLPADVLKANYGIAVPRSVATNTVTSSVAQGLAWPGETLPPLQNKLREVVSDVAQYLPAIDNATLVTAQGTSKEAVSSLSERFGLFIESMKEKLECKPRVIAEFEKEDGVLSL